MAEGWIKLYRRLLDKAIWECSTPEQKVILITLLLMANHDEKEWEWNGKKFKCEPGQFVTSLSSIAQKAGKGISIKNVRTALEKFKKYEFLAYESTKTGRLITIVNYGIYQAKEKETGKDTGKEPANNGQTTGKQVATNKNVRSSTTTPTTIEDEPVDNVDKSNYIDFFNNNFGHLITAFEVETLEGYIRDGIEPDVIVLALQEAVEANIRDMRYVKKVLDRWKNNQLNTVEAVMADKRDFELKVKQQSENKAQGRSAANYNKKKSTSNNFKGRSYSKDQIKDLESKLLGLEGDG